MRAGLFDDGVENGRIDHRQIAEHLTVERDSRGNQRRDEPVVVDPALAQRGVEAGDPELAEVALALPAVAVGVDAGLAREFEGLTVNRSGPADEAFGPSEDAFAFAAVGRAASGTRHVAPLENEWEPEALAPK